MGQRTVELHSWEQSFVDTISAKQRGTSERGEATETVQRVTRKNADAINSSRASKRRDGKRFQSDSEVRRQRFAPDESKQAPRRDGSGPSTCCCHWPEHLQLPPSGPRTERNSTKTQPGQATFPSSHRTILFKSSSPFGRISPLPCRVFPPHLGQQLVAAGLLLQVGWKFTICDGGTLGEVMYLV